MKNAGLILGTAVLYCLAAKAGLQMAFLNPSASAVWPPTGISLALLALFGYRIWPGILLGAFWANATTAGTWMTSAGIACGNTLEATAGFWFLQNFAGGRELFDRAGNILRYIFSVAFVSTAISATCGVTSLALGGFVAWDGYGPVWLTWWLGDMTSAIIVAPFLLTWIYLPYPRLSARRALEAAALFLVTIAMGAIMFAGWGDFARQNYPIDYLGIPFLVWAAFRFGVRGAAASAFGLSAVAIWGTLRGFGPFALESANESLVLLQGFMGVIMITALVLAAVLAERRRSEEELARNAQRLAESNRELEQFAAVASHDLQEPLHKIIIFSELVAREAETLSDAARQNVERVRGAAVRMQRLIEDLLTYSRPAGDEAASAVDLNEVIQGVLQDMEARIRELRAEVEVGPLPVLRVNELRMRQLLQNLLANALKFSKKDSRPRIRIFSRGAGGAGVQIVIEDNGIGFEEKYAERIFEPFQRLHSRQEYEGSGIGLALCRKIVRQHGGEIRATGRPGIGSTFVITLGEQRVVR